MKMFPSWIILLLALSSVSCVENGKKNDAQNVVEYPENRSYCDKMFVMNWTIDFHDCFFERKYKDGGEDFENIVDRIWQHAEQCATSIRLCQPDSQGFKDIMNKIITQIKDYAEMYLEEILKGRENIKDLECVERYLSLNNYVKCFQTQLRRLSVSQKSFERRVKEGISCVDRSNQGCSIEAKYSLGRIVGKIFGIAYKQESKSPLPPTIKTSPLPITETPPLPSIETSPPPTTKTPPPPTTKTPPPPTTKTPPLPSTKRSYPSRPQTPIVSSTKRPLPSSTERQPPPITEPPPKRWYDYIIQPFITAWRYIRSFFG